MLLTPLASMTGNLSIWTVLCTLATIVFASSTTAASAQHHDSRTLKSSNLAFARHHRLSPAHSKQENITSVLSARSHKGKSIIGNQKDIHDEPFDYLIIGGGTAGLTLANRLTDDASIRVLVLEAGHDGYDADDNLLVPNAAYWNSAVGGRLDWNYFTKNQRGLWGRVTPWPRGRTLGGSAAVNGLYYVRHGTREGEMFARQAHQLGDVQGSSWTWNKVKEAYQKSSHFRSRAESAAPSSRDDDEWEADFVKHKIGSPEGPVQLSYSKQHFEVNTKWIPAFEELGIGKAQDPYDGDNLGPFVAPTTMDSRSWTRSFSRTAYLDDVADRRSNLQVITGHTVTKILFEGAKDDEVVEAKRRKRQQGERRAVGVEFASGPNKDRHTVRARREVILSAGAIATPQILQLSGVGERKLLRKYDIDVVKNLPGVGHHLQDHLSIPLMHHVENGVRLQNKDDKSYTDSAIAYLTLKDLYEGDQGKANDFLDRARRMTEEYLQHNTSNVPSSVKKGYARALHTLTNDLLSENSASGFGGAPKGAMEILLSTMHDKITLQNALQAPFSRGSIKINSKDPFDHPTIDPHYLSHPADGELLARALSLSRKLAKTKALGPLITGETNTTSKVEGPPTFKTWESHIRLHAATEYHPSSSCSMAPEDEGGVVDAELKVYGFKNLRIVDASIVGQSPSSHLVSYTYAVAEIAAEKIKADRR